MFILLGLCFCSRISAFFALLGSFLGLSVALLLGADLSEIEIGLWGYNAVLGTMAIGGIFYSLNISTFLLACSCGVLSTLLFAPLRILLAPFPVMTFPFCAAAIIFVLMQGSSPRAMPIDLVTITTPEGHLRRLKEHRSKT